MSSSDVPLPGQDWAQGLKCKDLRNTCRVLRVPNYSRMSKADMIRECDYRRALLKGWGIDPDSAPVEVQLKAFRDNLKGKCGPGVNTDNMTEEELIECSRKLRVGHVRDAVEKKYSKSKIDESKGEKRPSFHYGTPNDCPAGYFRRLRTDKNKTTNTSDGGSSEKKKEEEEEREWVCLEMRRYLDVMTTDELRQLCTDCPADISDQDILKQLLQNHIEAEDELNAYIARQQFRTKDEQEIVGKLCSILQTEFASGLAKQLSDLQDFFGAEKEDCSGVEGKKKQQQSSYYETKDQDAAVAKLSRSRAIGLWILSHLSRATKALGSAAKSAVPTVLGSLGRWMFQTLKTIPGKVLDLAAWIARDPRSARIILFLVQNKIFHLIVLFLVVQAIRLKKTMCKKLKQWMSSHKEATKDAVNETKRQLEEAGAIVKELALGPMLQDVLGKMIPKAVEKICSRGSVFLSKAVSSIPFVGGFLSASVEIVADTAGESLTDAAQFALDVTFFQENLTECVINVLTFVDLEDCLTEIYGEKNRVVLWIRWIKAKIDYNAAVKDFEALRKKNKKQDKKEDKDESSTERTTAIVSSSAS